MDIRAKSARAAIKAGKVKVLKGRRARKLVSASARNLDILQLDGGGTREVAAFEFRVAR